MKSERRSFPQACRCVRGENAIAFQSQVQGTSGKVANTHLSSEIDVDKLLHFSQQLYAHALTLQEVIRTHGEPSYEVLRSRYDRQAAQQFEVFYQSFKRP